MRSINATVASQLDAGRIVMRELVRLSLGSGDYGLARSVEPITISGLTYQPLGVMNISAFEFAPGANAQPFSIELPAKNDDGRLPSVLQNLFNEDYRDRPVTVFDAHFNASTGAYITALTTRYGRVNQLSWQRSKEGGAVFVLECLSRAIDYGRRNGRMANDLDQQRRSSGDRFYQHLSTTGRVRIPWGRAKV